MQQEEYIKCHDCKTEMSIYNERVYEYDLGFLGTIELCHECLIKRGSDSCDYCGEIYDLDDMVTTKDDYLCELCNSEINK
jgi:hypothetical protein